MTPESRLGVAWLVLTACGPHASRPSHGGPPYLAMFRAGASWTLRAGTPGAVDAVTCSIATVTRLGDSTVSRLTCAKPHDDLGIVGWWVAAPAGLYHPATAPENPDDLAALTEDDLLINAHADERHHAVALGDTHEMIDAIPFGHGWCTSTETTNGADRRAWTLCVDDTGIVGVADIVAAPGAATASARFGALPTDDAVE
jgi:hypothetical protein